MTFKDGIQCPVSFIELSSLQGSCAHVLPPSYSYSCQSAISHYNTTLLSWATDMLCQRLPLSPLPIPPEMRAPFMSVMVLPDCLGSPTPENELDLMERLFHKYNVQTTMCLVDKRLCCRSDV